MEAVLHIEPVMRHAQAPICIGHSDRIFYGSSITRDDENIGVAASNLELGCPLEVSDLGSTSSHIPLVKTIEYTPDFSKSSGFVYSETLHYVLNSQFLVPYRTKIRSGLGQGSRFTHIPSLNLIRETISGFPYSVIDPRAEIVADIALCDSMFDKRQNEHLKEWIADDLTRKLSNQPVNHLSLDTSDTSSMIHKYIGQVHSTPCELTPQNLNSITSIIAPNFAAAPVQYLKKDFIQQHLMAVKSKLVTHPHNFSSLGNIPVESLSRIEFNAFNFRAVGELLDQIPLTDFNIDLIVSHEGEIVFYHEHQAMDRLAVFEDYELGLYNPETILREYLAEYVVNDILNKFLYLHSYMTPEIQDIIKFSAVKMKFIKTVTDEAIVLLYRGNSPANEAPLCGIYFDIAQLSLAPMSIMREPVLN